MNKEFSRANAHGHIRAGDRNEATSQKQKPGACAPGLGQDCRVVYFCGFDVPWELFLKGVICALVASL
jgi:hypothetical protein